MKTFILLFLMFVSCAKADDVDPNKRLVAYPQSVSMNQPLAAPDWLRDFWIIKDLKTGKEFLLVHDKNGTSVMEIQ
jgi:hypothetical protein